MTLLEPQIDMLSHVQTMQVTGTVRGVRGLSIEVDDLPLPIGSLVSIRPRQGTDQDERSIPGEVVGFNKSCSVVMLLGAGQGIAPGSIVVGEQSAQTVQVGQSLLGRVLDGLGRPIDGRPLRQALARQRLGRGQERSEGTEARVV